MSSWADEANGNESVDQENFKAERIISQTPDGREKVLFSAIVHFRLLPPYAQKHEREEAMKHCGQDGLPHQLDTLLRQIVLLDCCCPYVYACVVSCADQGHN